MGINWTALEDGITVSSIGFLIVFLFLCLLIFAMNIMSFCIGYLNKIFPAVSPAELPVKKTPSGIDEEIAVAIAAALLKENN